MSQFIKREGNVIVLTGPSGVGKGSIVSKIVDKHCDIVLSVSATTRAKRPGELEGVHYYFISKEKFQELIDSDQMLEWAEFAGNYYGTFREAVDKYTELGKDVILEIEVQGAMQVKQKLSAAILIFVSPPSFDELKSRLVGRATETEEAVTKRLATAEKELQSVTEFQYNIINDDLNKAIKEVEKIILDHREK